MSRLSKLRNLRRTQRRNRLQLQAAAPIVCKPIHLSGPCDIQAAKEGDDDALPTFTMVANTGVPMRVSGYYDPVIVNMKGVSFAAKRLPVVADHDISASSRVGHTTKVTKTKNTITVVGVISATGTVATEIRADAKNGFPFQTSIGASVEEAMHVPEGDTVKVNGQTYKGPLVVASKTTVYEFTVTSVGADQNTSFDVAATLAAQGVTEMNFQKWLAARGLTEEGMSPETLSALKLCYDAEIKAAKDAELKATKDAAAAAADAALTGDGGSDTTSTLNAARQGVIDDIRAAGAAERQRTAAFASLEAEYSEGLDKDKLAEIRAAADADNWTAERFELQLRRDSRPPARLFSVHTGNNVANNAEVIECSLLLNSGYSSEEHIGKVFKEDIVNAAMSKQFKTYGLKRLCHEVINAAGMHYQFGVYDNGFIEATIRADNRMIRAASGGPGNTSPISVSGILSNVMHKLLLNSFTGDSNGMAMIEALSSSRTVTDFKDHPVYRLTGIGEYADVRPGGELKGMSLGEESNAISADTRGVLIVLDRVQIVNDDLGAFAKIPALVGRKARMKFLKVTFNTFLDDAAFYTTARGNLLESTAFDIAGISAAVRLFRKMKDINGDPVDVNPSNIMTSSLYEVEADQFYKDTNVMVWDRDAAGAATTAKTNGNPHKGKYGPISSSWLDTDSVVTGGADDSWYVASNEEDMKPLQIAYLNGNRTPIIERCELPADRLGVGWRSYFDFGAARQEWRGSVKVLAGVAAAQATAIDPNIPKADNGNGNKASRKPARR